MNEKTIDKQKRQEEWAKTHNALIRVWDGTERLARVLEKARGACEAENHRRRPPGWPTNRDNENWRSFIKEVCRPIHEEYQNFVYAQKQSERDLETASKEEISDE